MSEPILIAGGGIGGLVLAVALERAGLEAEVLERRHSFGDEGAGIVLGPNAMSVLDALGLADAIRAAGLVLRAGRIADARGRTLMEVFYEDPSGRLPPAVTIHRARLHEVLRAAVSGPVHLGSAVTAVHTDPSGTTVTLADGRTRRTPLLVGADGIGSAVRAATFGEVPVRYSGYTCWRAVLDEPIGEAMVEVWGRGRRCGVVSLAEGRTYVFLTANAPRRAPPPWSDLDGFRSFFDGVGEVARRVVAAVPSLDVLIHNDLEDLLMPVWWRDRVVLLGDAAHAVTPNMGQGAGMAIEDALVLADALRTHGVGPAALDAYQAQRLARVREVHGRSWQLGRFAQLEAPLATWARDLAASLTPRALGRRELQRLFAGTPQPAGTPPCAGTPGAA